MSSNCEKHEAMIAEIKDDLKDIKSDVRSLLKFKWQVMGGAGVIGVLLSFIVSKI